MTKLIGLTGPPRGSGLGTAGCGKDTAAAALVSAGWTRDAFADRMRTAMLALDPLVMNGRDQLYRLSEIVAREGWDTAKRDHPEVRRLLQKFGTEAGRDIHGTDCWVNLLFKKTWWDSEDGSVPVVSNRENRRSGVVVTDCRFENEAEAIRRAGGLVISITRPGLAHLDGGNSSHPSEDGLPDHLIDARIVNEGTVADLHRAILDIAGTI